MQRVTRLKPSKAVSFSSSTPPPELAGSSPSGSVPLGAKVAVVGAEHRGRGDDAATNAAFLCKELAEIGMVALPYRADIERADTFRTLPAQIAADLGSVAVCVVVIPAAPCTGERTAAYRAMSATVAAALPPGARHIEIDMADCTEGHEEAAHGLVDQLLHRRPQSC